MGRCPACGREYPAEVAICIPCGVEMATGRTLTSKTLAPDALNDLVPEEQAPETGKEPPKPTVFDWIQGLFPGFFRPATLLAVLFAWGLSLAVMYVGLMLFALLLFIEPFLVCGLGMLIYWQSLVWLQTGRFVLLQNGLAEYVGLQWLVFLVAAIVPLCAVLLLAVHLRDQTA